MTLNLVNNLNTVLIRTNSKDNSNYNLVLKSVLTNDTYTIEVVDLSPTLNKFSFSFNLPENIVEGEFLYYVKSTDNTITYRSGIAYYVTMTKNMTNYSSNKTNVIYERDK